MFIYNPGPDPWHLSWLTDPDIRILLDKATIAQIKVKELDFRIVQLEKAIELTKTIRNTIKQQYK
jgi:hypothetical protein